MSSVQARMAAIRNGHSSSALDLRPGAISRSETSPAILDSGRNPDSRRSSESFARAGKWVHSFLKADPRRQLADFFRPGDHRGPLGVLHSKGLIPEGEPSSFFTVWRPTSMDAIRMMIEGTATGKGLNVKGKSSQQGVLSGFVPFLQICEEEHKKLVGTSPKAARLRVYYQTKESRDEARATLDPILQEMVDASEPAEELLADEQAGRLELSDDEREETLHWTRWTMAEPRVTEIDTFAPEAWGLDVPERLFMESYVQRRDISHEEGWETGRGSEPAFMDLNLHATRDDKYVPKAVVWQYDAERPMNPRGLLVAYEEAGVKPVASDFDGFLLGSRGMDFAPLPEEQVKLVHWTIDNIEGVLQEPSPAGWTKRWLEVLKREAQKGFHPDVPRFGFGDPTSYQIMVDCTDKLNMSGAVRHGAECFNFYFPQDLDQQFLVCWEGFDRMSLKGAAPFQYLDVAGLQRFLRERIAEGFAFPLNPKWVLCDPGWFDLFQRLQRSRGPGVQAALDSWMPPHSRLRERIAEVHSLHPAGFAPTHAGAQGEPAEEEQMDGDMAAYELARFLTLRRAKRKLQAVLFWMKFAGAKQKMAKAVDEDEQAEAAPPPPPPPPPPNGGHATAKAAPNGGRAAAAHGANGTAAADARIGDWSPAALEESIRKFGLEELMQQAFAAAARDGAPEPLLYVADFLEKESARLERRLGV